MQGTTISIHGRKVEIKGQVLVLLADTLAAHAIGGFKIGVGFSLRKCRVCMATADSMSDKVMSLAQRMLVCAATSLKYFLFNIPSSDLRTLLLELQPCMIIIVLFYWDHWLLLIQLPMVSTTKVH